MPAILTIGQICERALRKIGAYSINDDGARQVEMEEARFWLDLVVGHVAARRRTWWLVPQTATLTLVPGQSSYPLAAAVGATLGVQHVIDIWAADKESGKKTGITIARRDEWDARQPSDSNLPALVYIDRTREPTLHVWPAPPNPATHDLLVTFQRFSTDMRQGELNLNLPDLRQTWNLFLITRLAYELGNGPVRKLPADEVAEMLAQSDKLLRELEEYDGLEQAGQPRQIAYNDF